MKPLPHLHVINSLAKLGPVNVLHSIVCSMDRTRFTPIIVCLRGEDEAGNDGAFLRLGIEIVYLRYSLFYLECQPHRVAHRVATIARERGAAIVHAHGYHPDMVVSVMPEDFTKISTQHNISREDFRYGKGLLLGSYMDARLWHYLPKMNALVGITDYVAHYCRERLGATPKSEVYTILNGIDTSSFSPLSAEERTILRGELFPDLPSDAPLFVVVGSLSPRKDPLFIIETFARLLRSGALPDGATLLLLGKGELEERCRRAAERYEGSIRLLGFRHDVARYMRACDVLVSASHSEGFGLNVAEALLCGLSVVATDLPVYRELMMQEATLIDLLYPIGDGEALALALVSSLGRRLSPELHSRLCVHLAQERMARQYGEIYECLLDSNDDSR